MSRNKQDFVVFWNEQKGYFYYHCYDSKDKRLTFSTKEKTITKARNKVNQLYKEGNLIPPSRNKEIFGTFTKDFFNPSKSKYIKYQKGIGKENKLNYYQKCDGILNNHILPYFETFNLKAIKKVEIIEFFNSIESNSLKNQIKTILNIIFNYAIELEKITKNPLTDIKSFKKVEKKRDILTEIEITKLFDKNTLSSVWNDNFLMYAIARLSSLTGMRIGELQSLRVEDIKSDRIEIHRNYDSKNHIFITTKTESSNRDFPLVGEAKNLCNLLTQNKLGGLIFSLDGVSPISLTTIHKHLKRALERIGISEKEKKERNIVFHSFRHYFCTLLATKGLTPLQIQRLSGHADIDTLQGYTNHNDFNNSFKLLASVM